MEGKVIIYIIIGIGYFIYTSIKKANEKKPAKTARPTAAPKKARTTFDEVMEQVKRELQTTQPQPAKPRQPKPVAKPKREILLRENVPAAFEEGSATEPLYERQLTAEEILHNERMRAATSVSLESSVDEGSGYQLKVREAFIGSIIFERKF